MASTEELEAQILADMESDPEAYADTEIEYCTVDDDTRVVTVPEKYRKLGAESDEAAKRVWFRFPKLVGNNGIDLSAVSVRVNFRNANGDGDIYMVQDLTADGDNVVFSWELSRKVTTYKGSVSFVVCAVKSNTSGVVKNEWNTTLNRECEVLEGLEVSEQITQENPDIIEYILANLGGSVSAEEIATAVEEYMAAHPFTETDPTVPEWAKQPQKPTYTAEDVGALPVGTKIPSKTSDLENDSKFLIQPASAKVGQTFRVKTVNEDGTMVLEAVDVTSGTGGKSAYQYALEGGYTGTEEEFTQKMAAEYPMDVQINGTSIVGEDGVADISKLLDETLTHNTKAAPAGEVGKLKSEVDTKVNNAIIEKVITENTVATSLFNFWTNKKGGCLGDSISEGYHTDKTFYTVTKELLNMSDFINYGISGSCIGGSHANAMSKRYTQMSDDLDVIVVAGGVNDMGTNIDLGNINSNDETTFYGALKVLCEGLINKYPTKQIIFITPSHIGKPIDFYDEPNARGYNLKDYANAIIEVCGLYSIPVFDGYRLSGIYPENTVNRTVYTHDGLHWNTNGHYRVGLKLAQFMLFGCIPNQIDNNGDGEEVTTYTITNNLSNATNSNVSNSVESGHSYNANISANSGYVLSSVSVVMNSNDITSNVYSNGVINIPSVTGNVIITVVAVEETIEAIVYTITNTLTNVTNNNSNTSIEENNSYTANLSAKDGYILDSVTVTMGGVDITSTSYSNGTINISKVTGNIIIIAKAIAEVVSYVGKTMTLNGFKNMGFHIVPLIAVDEDAVSGNVVKHVLKISNPINIVTTRGFATTGFGDNTGEVSNSAYSGTYGGNTSLVATQEDGKYVFTIERTLTGTPTQPYLKFPMGISFENGNPPGSFVIEDIKSYVNGIEKPILKLGGFWKEETFTLS